MTFKSKQGIQPIKCWFFFRVFFSLFIFRDIIRKQNRVKNVQMLLALCFQKQIINRMSPKEKSGSLLGVSLCAQVLFMSARMPISARALSSPDPAVTSSPLRKKSGFHPRVIPSTHLYGVFTWARASLCLFVRTDACICWSDLPTTLSAWSPDRFAITRPLWESRSSADFLNLQLHFLRCCYAGLTTGDDVRKGPPLKKFSLHILHLRNASACTSPAPTLAVRSLAAANHGYVGVTTLFFSTRWNNFLLRVGCIL